ncbi:MAG: diguanylate cyclase [Myxococcales bacterium]|jgi:diguanylate cyclase (GGDEF)-like protein
MPKGIPADAAFELKLIFLRELDAGYREARKTLADLKRGPGDRESVVALRGFFHKLAGTAYAADLTILGQLGAVCERAADLWLDGKLTDSAALAAMFSEALVGVASALESAEPALPRPPVATPAVLPVATGAEERGLSKILVIDDDPFSARLIDSTLRAAGFSSSYCCDPRQALAVISSELPDLLIMDVVMPGLDGFDLCRSVRSNPAMQLTPIIFVTRHGDVEQRVAGLEAGGNDYIAKPFEPQELVARVRSHLQRLAVLRDMAIRDGLTRCYNHRYFKSRLEQEIARARRYRSNLAVAMLDVDFFKRVNDTYGHAAGDAVLANLASLAMASVRTTDVVARYGGEEFALLLIEASAKEAEVISNRLRERIAGRAVGFTDSAGAAIEIPITVSIGVTDLRAGDTAQSILERADSALYAAKAEGRNLVRVAGS